MNDWSAGTIMSGWKFMPRVTVRFICVWPTTIDNPESQELEYNSRQTLHEVYCRGTDMNTMKGSSWWETAFDTAHGRSRRYDLQRRFGTDGSAVEQVWSVWRCHSANMSGRCSELKTHQANRGSSSLTHMTFRGIKKTICDVQDKVKKCSVNQTLEISLGTLRIKIWRSWYRVWFHTGPLKAPL